MTANYGHVTASRLACLLEQDGLDTAASIELAELTNDLVVAFLVAGHSLKFTGPIADQLLEGYRHDGGHFATNFPHGIDPRSENFESDVRRLVDGLTPSQRAARIEEYLKPHTSRRRYIFQVRGLRIADSMDLGDATIYDPRTESKISGNGQWHPDETFRQKATSISFPNIAVLVDCDTRDDAASEYRAIAAAGRYLDLIKPHVTATSVLRVVSDEYLVTDESWRCIASSASSAKDEHVVQATAAPELPLPGREEAWTKFVASFGRARLLEPRTDATRRLSQALHVSRRGAEATRHDDKLTHHWVVLETLLPIDEWKASGAAKHDESAIGIIRRVLPALFVRRFFFFNVGWQLHGLLRSLTRSDFGGSPKLRLSSDLVERCMLTPCGGQKLHLRDVLQSLPELLAEIVPDAHPRLRERIQDTIAFYSEPKCASERIRGCIEHCRATLDRLYRARNRILHDAVSELPLLEALAEYSADISRALLYEAILNLDRNQSLTDTLLEIEAQVDRVQAALRKGRRIDFLDLPEPQGS
jgi:hypothetical protein